MTIDEIRDNFAPLEEWDDRYRYVIELGRMLEPLPDAEHSPSEQSAGLRQPGLAVEAGRSRNATAWSCSIAATVTPTSCVD